MKKEFEVYCLFICLSLVGFEILTAMTMKSSVFWDVTLQSGENQLTFWRRLSAPSSGLKSKLSKKPA
jgi:hypothetical protein